jgi:hypothetical protein
MNVNQIGTYGSILSFVIQPASLAVRAIVIDASLPRLRVPFVPGQLNCL